MPRIAASNAADTTRQCIGVVVVPAGGNAAKDIVKVYTAGAVLNTSPAGTGYPLNAPLYDSASTGQLTFSNVSVSGVPRVIARLISSGSAYTTATVRVVLENP